MTTTEKVLAGTLLIGTAAAVTAAVVFANRRRLESQLVNLATGQPANAPPQYAYTPPPTPAPQPTSNNYTPPAGTSQTVTDVLSVWGMLNSTAGQVFNAINSWSW